VGPGVCFRLYSEDDYRDRTEFSIPEIQRTNLAEVILQMIQLDLGNPEDFPFLNPPKPAAIHDGYRTLTDLGAIDEHNRLTRYGKIMCSLPIDPTISRIIIEAEKNGCLTEITIIAAALAIADPRVRPAEKEQLADRAHNSFAHPGSDFSALLNIWTRFHRENKTFSWTKLKRFCATNFLSFQRMREWFDLHDQLLRILKRKRSFQFNANPASYEMLHQALLSGLFRQCARRKQGLVYQNSGNAELLVFPGSHQFKKSGDLILVGALVETSKLYGLTVATIEPEWVETAAKKFCTYSWSNPRWQKKTGRVVADESVSLQGLLLLSNRIVNFGARHRRNRAEARKIFIQKALVEGTIREPSGFLEHNQELLATWRETEKQLRKRHIVMDDIALFDFYDHRLADQVYDRTSLLKYLKKVDPKQLFLSQKDVLVNRPDDAELLNFPHTLEIGGVRLQLSYCFEPGQERDGITIHIPETHSHSINTDIFDWLVPGLILEKTVYMLKGLPKSVRKKIIPVQATAERILDSVDYGQGNYITSLSTALLKFFRITIQRKDWPETLPAHLGFFFVITDAEGREIRSGKNFAELVSQLRDPSERIEHGWLGEQDRRLVEELSGRSYVAWDFSTIPKRIPLYTKNRTVAGYLYPALEPAADGRSVTIQFLDSHLAASELNGKGTHVLLQQVFKQQTRELKKYCRLTLSSPSAAWLTAAHGGSAKVQDAILALVMRTIFGPSFPEITSEKEFADLVELGNRENFYARGKDTIDAVFKLLRQRKEVLDMIAKYRGRAGGGEAAANLYDDLTDRLHILMPGDFIDTLQPGGQDNLERYLKSLLIRVERAHSNPAKDIKKRAQLAVHQQRLDQLKEKQHWNNQCAELYEHYQHLIDEMHVSLFSPELKTITPVSDKKLQDTWNKLQQMC
jgi:ATP-dependent helicase HrpA